MAGPKKPGGTCTTVGGFLSRAGFAPLLYKVGIVFLLKDVCFQGWLLVYCFALPQALVLYAQFQAPRMIRNPDSVTSEPTIDPASSVALQSRSVSALHPHLRYQRYYACLKQLLCE